MFLNCAGFCGPCTSRGPTVTLLLTQELAHVDPPEWFAERRWIGSLTHVSPGKFIHAISTDERNGLFFVFLKLT